MVPRGGIELSSIVLRLRDFSNDDFPVYPLMYPAFGALWQRVRSRSFTFDASISMANHWPKPSSVSSIVVLRKQRSHVRVRHFTILRDIALCRSGMPQQPAEGAMPYCDGRLPAKAYKQPHRSQAARSIL